METANTTTPAAKDFDLVLVDDESRILKCASRLLKGEGLKIYATTSAEDALVVLQDGKAKALISDWNMPGQTTAKDLVDAAVEQGMPVAVVSGHAEGAFGNGVRVFDKPASYTDIASALLKEAS